MSCTLYLVRHGIADDPTDGMSDADRALTSAGARKMTSAARGLRQLGIVPDLVLSSPLRRAEETAALLARVLVPKRTVEIYPPLAPGHTTAEIIKGLHAYRRARNVVLVGHQPGLGDLASHLLTGSDSLLPLPFKKGGAAAIEVDALPPRAAGALAWFVTPKQLRAMGRGGR